MTSRMSQCHTKTFVSLGAPVQRLGSASFSSSTPQLTQRLCLQRVRTHFANQRSQRSVTTVLAKSSPDSAEIGKLKGFASTQLFRVWIQGAVFVIVLAAVDAAFSGDWSRIGVISKSTEQGLQPLVIALGVFHIACATVAARSAASKNISVPPAVLKVLAVGFLAMVEVLLADPQPEQ